MDRELFKSIDKLEANDLAKRRNELLETSLFDRYYSNEIFLLLEGTLFFIRIDDLQWINLRDWTGGKNISFEEVLDSMPEDIQTELLFHLNLFT
jgi:hypothetical protein